MSFGSISQIKKGSVGDEFFHFCLIVSSILRTCATLRPGMALVTSRFFEPFFDAIFFLILFTHKFAVFRSF